MMAYYVNSAAQFYRLFPPPTLGIGRDLVKWKNVAESAAASAYASF